MPTQIYKNDKKKRLPSVTTVLANLGWNKDPLMYWAWNEGIEGRNFRDTSGAAATVGTMAHFAVEASIKGEEFDIATLGLDEESTEKVARCVEAWDTWRKQSRLQMIASEVPLVSEEHQFGGTLDCAAVLDKTSILDIKTSKGVYPDHRLQVAAYGKLWNENYPDQQVEEYHIIQLGKDDASFSHYYFPNLDKQWEAFQHALALHRLKKVV